MIFLGANVFDTIINFFQTIKASIPLEYLLYIFLGLEVFTILVFIVLTYNVYELKLIRAVDKINAYLYEVQYINDSNLIEFNNKMKRVPKTLRYHWQQYMLYREKPPSYYMSIENCIDRPLKASAFASNIKVVRNLGIVYAILSFIFSCGWATALPTVGTDYFVAIFMVPLAVLLLNYIFLIGLGIKKSSNTGDLYQTFHIFNRFIDKAVSTLPEYVDFEVLFTRKEIKRGIPVLNEYIEKRQIQEQEEMRRARENAVQHELFNFENAGEKGELILERAMKETEIFVNLRNRLNAEIEQIEKEIESYKRTYENTTKDYQKKLQASKENVERLREQQESTTNRIESNYLRKQQLDEIKKQQQIEKDQDDATLRFNQEINTLAAEIKKRKQELEGARLNVEKAMLSEYKTFANKVFVEIKDSANVKVKEEREELITSRQKVAHELEEALTRVEQLEKQNKVLVTKAREREDYIRAEMAKEKEGLITELAEKQNLLQEKDQYIELITSNPDQQLKISSKDTNDKTKVQPVSKSPKSKDKKVTVGEFSFDDKEGDKTVTEEAPTATVRSKVEINRIDTKKVEETKPKKKGFFGSFKDKFKNEPKKKGVVAGEFSFDDQSHKGEVVSQETYENEDKSELIGTYDSEGNYRFANGSYYDAQGYFHDENGYIYDPQGNLVSDINRIDKVEFESQEETQEEDKSNETEDDLGYFVEEKNVSKTDVNSEKKEVKETKKGLDEIVDIKDLMKFFQIKDSFDESDENTKAVKNEVENNIESTKIVGENKIVGSAQPNEEGETKIKLFKDIEILSKEDETDNSEVEFKPTEKKRRGRPRKEVVEVKPLRGRGRPRKEKPLEDDKAPKKRGRPRKAVAEVKPKAKRGRPRKSEQVVTLQKRRGRPRKSNIDENLKEIENKLKKQNDLLKKQQQDLKLTVNKVTKPRK